MKMNDLTAQIKAAMSFPVAVKITDMTCYNKGILITVYSNAPGLTVETRHPSTQSVADIVSEHIAARAPVAVKKERKIRDRVHRQVFGPDRA